VTVVAAALTVFVIVAGLALTVFNASVLGSGSLCKATADGAPGLWGTLLTA
jgi:hypothetical protein